MTDQLVGAEPARNRTPKNTAEQVPARSGSSAGVAEYEKFRDVFDDGRHWRARLGFVLLAMEQTIDSDLHRMAPDGVGVHVTRAPMANSVTVETLDAMFPGIRPAAELLVPELTLDVACYACTSGTVVMGERPIEEELAAGSGARHTTTLLGGVLAALRALQARRISVVTPYVAGINDLERTYLQQQGFEIDTLRGLEIELDQDIARVRPEFLVSYAEQVADPGSDALFVSCGALRSVDVITELEQRIGMPVVTSNQAMMWHCLRLAGIDDRREDLGVVFRDH